MANGATEKQTNILKLVAGMFNAAPGATYLWEVETAFGAVGWDYSALARGLSQTTFFKSLYPSDLSTQAFADKFLGTLGLADVADAQQWIRYHATTGKPYAQLMLEALVALDASSDAVYASARQLLANKATVAEHYSVTQTKSAYEMGTLQGVLAMVRPDSNLSILSMDALIKAGIEAANAQQLALVIVDVAGRAQTLNDWQPGQEVLIQGASQSDENGWPVYELSTVAGEKAPALKITLDKSALLHDGIALGTLIVAANAGTEPGASSVRALELVVIGEAEYSVNSLRAEGVNELRLSGGADFRLCVDAMDTQDLLIDGSAMPGKLTLFLDGEMLIRLLEAAKTGSVQLIGGQSQHDILYLGEYEATHYKTAAPLSIKGFETIILRNFMEFDTAKIQGVSLYKNEVADPLLLTSLSAQTAVSRGTKDGVFAAPAILIPSDIDDPYSAPYGSDQGFVTEQYGADSVLNFELVGGRGHKLQTDGFESLSIDVRAGQIWYQFLAEQRFDLSEQAYDKFTGKWLAGTDASDIAAGAPVPLNHISKIELHKLSITSDLYDPTEGWNMKVMEGQTSKVTLGTLLSTINVLDVSGYSGQVIATLGARETAMVGAVKFDSGDVLVKVGTYGLDITDDHSVARITTFEFTTDSKSGAWEFDVLKWKVTGFQTAHKDVSGAVTDATVLDISALGVRGLAGLSLEQKGADLHIRAKDFSKAFEILLAGVEQTDLKAENFKFA